MRLEPGAKGRPGKVGGLETSLKDSTPRVCLLGYRGSSRKQKSVSVPHGQKSQTISVHKSIAHFRNQGSAEAPMVHACVKSLQSCPTLCNPYGLYPARLLCP